MILRSFVMLLTACMLSSPSLAAIAGDMQKKLEAETDSQQITGAAAAVVSDGQIVFAGGSGLADLASGRPMTADTPMYLGSVSKVFTATLALQQIELRQLALSTPLASLEPLSDVPVGDVSVEQLLTHTSGVSREGDFGYWFSGEFPGVPALLTFLSTDTPQFAPGSRSSYSNVGYAALGQLIARSDGSDFSTVLQERLLQPLTMPATGVDGIPDGLAVGYTPRNRLLPSAEKPFAGVGDAIGQRHTRNYHDADAMAPAFGIYSTAADMARFVRFLLLGDAAILSDGYRQQMALPRAHGRGLGLRIEFRNSSRLARHGGWFAAHRSHLLLDLENRLGVIVMTNSDDADPDAIADSLYTTALEALAARSSEQSAN